MAPIRAPRSPCIGTCCPRLEPRGGPSSSSAALDVGLPHRPCQSSAASRLTACAVARRPRSISWTYVCNACYVWIDTVRPPHIFAHGLQCSVLRWSFHCRCFGRAESSFVLSRWVADLSACHSGSALYELFLSTKVDNESFYSSSPISSNRSC